MNSTGHILYGSINGSIWGCSGGLAIPTWVTFTFAVAPGAKPSSIATVSFTNTPVPLPVICENVLSPMGSIPKNQGNHIMRRFGTGSLSSPS